MSPSGMGESSRTASLSFSFLMISDSKLILWSIETFSKSCNDFQKWHHGVLSSFLAIVMWLLCLIKEVILILTLIPGTETKCPAFFWSPEPLPSLVWLPSLPWTSALYTSHSSDTSIQYVLSFLANKMWPYAKSILSNPGCPISLCFPFIT